MTKFSLENSFLITNKFIRVLYERFSDFWLREGYIKDVAATRKYLREKEVKYYGKTMD